MKETSNSVELHTRE